MADYTSNSDSKPVPHLAPKHGKFDYKRSFETVDPGADNDSPSKRYRSQMVLRSHAPSVNDQLAEQMDALAFVVEYHKN